MTKREKFLAGEKFRLLNDFFRYHYRPANGEFSSDKLMANSYPGDLVFKEYAQVTHCTDRAAYYSFESLLTHETFTNKVEFEAMIFEENTQKS